MSLIKFTQKDQLARLGAGFISTKNKQGWGGRTGWGAGAGRWVEEQRAWGFGSLDAGLIFKDLLRCEKISANS